MSQAVTIEPALPIHAEILSQLHASGFEKPWPPEAFVSLLGDPIRSGALALAGGDPAGLVLLQQTAGEAEILTLVVRRESRRAGIARRLMKWAIEAAGENGAERLVLDVSETNEAARRLYDSLEFVEIGQRTGYYRRSGGPETALTLARSVVPGLPTR